MQSLPKLSISQLAGILLVMTTGTVALTVLPVGVQVEESQKTSDQGQAKTEPAQESQKSPALAEGKNKDETPPPVHAASAQELFDQARQQLLGRKYRAKIVEKLQFADRTLEATGRIVRGGKPYQLRLEFEVRSGGTVGKLLQVCDGDVLWTERRINKSPIRLTRQDVKLILKTAQQTSPMPQDTLIAELGLGGIASLLASLEHNMAFAAPETETVDGEPLRRLEGQWNAKFQAQFKANPQLAKGLPQHIPDGARVYFDRNDVPRRIQYLKKDSKQEVLRPMVTIDFLDVQWLTEADVKPADFEFKPPEGVYPKEVTEEYIKLLQPKAPAAAPPGQ